LSQHFEKVALLLEWQLISPPFSKESFNGWNNQQNIKQNGEQGWRSGESVCLPPMRPGFDSSLVPYVG